ncbi:myosin-1-like protein, partial [Tanacetum coccineum]
KPLELLTLLDEESTFPNATNMSFVDKIKQHSKSNLCFKGERGKAFTVRHYVVEAVEDVNHTKKWHRDTIVVEDNEDVIHDSTSSDVALSADLDDLDFTNIGMNDESTEVDALTDDDNNDDPDIIYDEDDVATDIGMMKKILLLALMMKLSLFVLKFILVRKKIDLKL